jgi:hypothetical protein
MEMVLDFDRPISVLKGREAARKILDALALAAPGTDFPEGFSGASVRCSELRRVLRVDVGETDP